MGEVFEAEIAGVACLCRFIAGDEPGMAGRDARRHREDSQPLTVWRTKADKNSLECRGPDGNEHQLSLAEWHAADPKTTSILVALVCVPTDLVTPSVRDDIDFWTTY
jgi:hypothetical protein